MLSYSEIESEVRRLCNLIDAPSWYAPTYGYSEQSGKPHVEVKDDGYHYVTAERGNEYDRRKTVDPDELYYWIMLHIVRSMGSLYEAHNRIPGQDHRRLAFARSMELMETLSHDWAQRLAQIHDGILANIPFADKQPNQSSP